VGPRFVPRRVLLLVVLSAGRLLPAPPLEIGATKQLLIDDHVVESLDGVFRVLNQPEKYEGNPVIQLHPPQPVGGKELVIAQGSVIYDEKEKLFKMWYEGATYDWKNNVVAYAYSQDGFHWTLPDLGLVQYNGSRRNNIVLTTGAGEMAPGVFKDVHETDPARLYKMLYCSKGNGSPVGVGFSPDGVHWRTVTEGNLIPKGDSLHPVLWDSKLSKYIAHSRHNAITPSGHERQVLQSESDDFENWTRYGVILQAGERDPPGHRQFYDMSWMIYEDVYIGFLSVYHVLRPEKQTPQQEWQDRVDVQLVFSRDDRHWTRVSERETFIPNGKTPGDCDYGMIYTLHRPMVVGDEIWIYYTGFSGLHWATRRQEIQGGTACLAKLRLDGFVSINTGSSGTLTTKPFLMSGDRLEVNVDTQRGSLEVEILDANGKPLNGFTRDDADAVTGDSVQHTVTWNGGSDVSKLEGKPVALRLYLRHGRLFSFQFTE